MSPVSTSWTQTTSPQFLQSQSPILTLPMSVSDSSIVDGSRGNTGTYSAAGSTLPSTSSLTVFEPTSVQDTRQGDPPVDTDGLGQSLQRVVYYESIKRELKTKPTVILFIINR
jgi:hypothetical protein